MYRCNAMQLNAAHFLPVQIDRHNIMTQIIQNQQEVHDTCSTSVKITSLTLNFEDSSLFPLLYFN